MTTSGREAGPLPDSAQSRLDVRRAGDVAHTSFLSASAAAALRSVGFGPIGDVMGCATTQIGYAYVDPCGGFEPAPRSSATSSGTPGPTRMSGGPDSYRGRLRSLYATALTRLTGEAVALGADGVVGISLTRQTHDQLHEVVAVGTAVRALGASARPAGPRPFTTDVSGSGVARLLLAGWVPVSMHVAVEVGRCHDTGPLTYWGAGYGNVEVASWTQLLQDTKAGVRRVLAAQVARSGAEGCVLSSLATRTRTAPCATYVGSTDDIAICVAAGTSITRFGHRQAPAPPLTIMPVSTRGGRT